MSQNSLVLPTSGTLSGLAAVEAINAAIDTLNTLASGASAPSSPEVGQLWHDTTNNLIKIRSQDNTAWTLIGSLDETNHVFNAAVKPSPNLYGLTLSNDTTAPNSVFDIAPGATYDSQAAVYMRVPAALKKNATAAWAAGSGNGSLDVGTWTASKFYHVHIIYNVATSAVDVLTSLSYSNPSLPTGYTNYAAIGAIYSNASSDIAAFTQRGSDFTYATQTTDYGTGGGGSMNATAQSISLTVPLGCSVKAKIRAALAANVTSSSTAVCAVLISSLDETDQAPTVYGPNSMGLGSYSATPVGSGCDIGVNTNTSGQVRLRSNTTYPNSQIWMYTYGFVYPRGLQ